MNAAGSINTTKTRSMVATALMTAVICALSPFSIPIGPVPISFTNLAIFLTLYLVGHKAGTVSVILYLLIGLAGVPVFSGFSGGIAKLAGPTGGYLIGYVPMAFIAGLFIDRFTAAREASVKTAAVHVAGMILGTIVLYTLGTAWFCFSMDSDVRAALGLCVIPFIPGDAAKMVIAALIGPVIKNRISHVL